MNTGQVKASEKTDWKSNSLGAILDHVEELGSRSTVQWVKLVRPRWQCVVGNKGTESERRPDDLRVHLGC